MPLDIERRHPDFETWSTQDNFLSRSYAGGTEYIGFLDKYPREEGAVFDARQARAYYLNYVAAVVDAYIAAVFKRDPAREVPDSFTPFIQDATRTGVDLTGFLREVMTSALATLRTYVVVDLDAESEPYVHQVNPANLLDFYKDPQTGEWLWALVAEEKVAAEDPMVERVVTQQFRLWQPTEWSVYDTDGVQIESGSNPAGEVPIIEVVPGNMPLPIYDIATVNKRIYNLCSQLDEILINVTFPQMYIQAGEGVETEAGDAVSGDLAPLVISTGRVLQLPTDGSMPPGFLSPPDGPAKLHIEERERLISAIYSLAGLERKDPDSQKVQSGVAKAYDFRETNSRLTSVAQSAERVEEEIFFLLNAYGSAGEFSVTYNKDFNVRDFTLALEDYLNISWTNLPAAAKRYAASELAGQIADDADPDKQKEIQAAVESMSDAELEANPAGTTAVLKTLTGRRAGQTAPQAPNVGSSTP